MAERLSSVLLSQYPQHHAPTYGSFHRRARTTHASSAETGVNFSCYELSRWAVQRCRRTLLYRTIVLVSMLSILVTCVLLRPTDYVLQDEQGYIHPLLFSPGNTSIWTSNGSGRLFTPVATYALPLNGSSVNVTQHNATVKPHVISISFAEKYAIHYAENDTDFLVEFHDIMDRQWRKNVSNFQEFRNDLRAALGDKGKLENFILTKQNTKAGTRIQFLYTPGTIRVSSLFWKFLASNTLYRPRLYNSCSVVGSGGILNGSRCGRSIDTADFVFRFNLAPVTNYAVDVGRKTNFTTLNPSILQTRLNSLRKKEDRSRFAGMLKEFSGSHMWMPAFAFKWKYSLMVRGADVARGSKNVVPIYGHPQHYGTVAKLWYNTLNGTQRTTTGLHVVSSIIDLCDNIDVYGFWPFKASLEGNPMPYHYYDRINGSNAVHSFSKEFKALASLHERGIIRLHLGPCA